MIGNYHCRTFSTPDASRDKHRLQKPNAMTYGVYKGVYGVYKGVYEGVGREGVYKGV